MKAEGHGTRFGAGTWMQMDHLKRRIYEEAHGIILTVLTLILVDGPALNAQTNDNDGCSDATLKGDYAFTISGQILHSDGTIDNRTGIAMRDFDGHGNIALQKLFQA
jgi:hypothetical protein